MYYNVHFVQNNIGRESSEGESRHVHVTSFLKVGGGIAAI